jgi:hypothetical protein
MASKKPKSETRKNKKLTLKKGTVRDLTARRDAGAAIRGGGKPNPSWGGCSY